MRRGRQAGSRLVVGALAAALAWALGAPLAAAHTGKQSYVYVDLLADRVEGRVEYLVADLDDVLGLGIADGLGSLPAPQRTDEAERRLEAARATLERFTRDHVSLDLGQGPVPLVYEELDYLDLSVGSYVVVHFTTGELGREPPRVFDVSYDAFFDEGPDRSALLLVGRDWKTGVYNNEASHLHVFDAGTTRQRVELDEGSWLRGVQGTVSLGVEHIRTGADHVMFILTLLLPAVLVFRSGSWRPAPSFRSSLWRVLKVASAFTVAHSVTLSLAGMGWLEVNSKLVESIIAVSIVLAALHNLRPVFANREWTLAFAFGLFHGLGFAGLLSELGLGRDQRIWSLLGFNVGVELGQAGIILMVFPVLYLLRRTRVYRIVLYGGSVALALAALGWALERIFELRPRVDQLFDPILLYPRVLVLVGVAFLVAAAVYITEKRRARLLPVTGDHAGEGLGA